jgi:hypothetical protein
MPQSLLLALAGAACWVGASAWGAASFLRGALLLLDSAL